MPAPHIMIGTRQMPVVITRKKPLRRISLRVSDRGEIKATAPYRTSIADILAFATSKAQWIESRMRAVASLYTPDQPTIFYRGDMTPIRLAHHQNQPNQPPVRHHNGCLWVNPAYGVPPLVLAQHIQQQTHSAIAKHLPPVLKQLGESEIRFVLSRAKTRWGSCHWQKRHGIYTKRQLRFNWRLAMATPAALIYVVVHEAAHLRHPNHSRDFWGLVASLMPDWQPAHAWLRHNQARLMIDFNRQLQYLTDEAHPPTKHTGH